MSTNKQTFFPGQTVVVPQFGKEAAGRIMTITGAIALVKMTEGPNTGYLLDVPLSMMRIPATFEVIASFEVGADQ